MNEPVRRVGPPRHRQARSSAAAARGRRLGIDSIVRSPRPHPTHPEWSRLRPDCAGSLSPAAMLSVGAPSATVGASLRIPPGTTSPGKLSTSGGWSTSRSHATSATPGSYPTQPSQRLPRSNPWPASGGHVLRADDLLRSALALGWRRPPLPTAACTVQVGSVPRRVACAEGSTRLPGLTGERVVPR